MKFVSRYLWIVCVLAGFFMLAETLKATLPQTVIGSWISASPLSQARANAPSVLLSDGRILVLGGDGASGPQQSIEVFATDGAVSPAAPMGVPRSHHFAVVLSDGRVLVGGGTTAGGGTTNSAEIYDPTADTWAQTAAMTSARANASAALLQDGRVLIAGGDNSGAPDNTLEVFDPSSNNFSFAGTLSSPRTKQAMAVLQDGRVLIVGGFDGNNPLSSSDIFDPSSGTASVGPSLSTARYSHSATTLMDGRVAVIGGTGSANNATVDLASAEVFDPAKGTFSDAGANLTTARQGHQAFLLPNNNSVLVVGGTSNGQLAATSELVVPQVSTADGSWSYSIALTGANITPRAAGSGSALQQDGLLLVAGGNDTSGNALATAELYAFPVVKTNAADYAPGTNVTITGSGFQPGETVNITLVESPLIDAPPVMSAVADGNGNFANTQFSPDVYDLNVRFYLTAIGSQSGLVAENTFTDSQPTAVNLTPASITVLAGSSAVYTTNVTMGGNGNNCTLTLSVSPNPVTTGAIPAFSGGANPFTTNADFSRTLTISTTGATAPGTYPFSVAAARSANCQGSGSTSGNGSLIVAGSATHFAVTGFPSPVTAGSSQSFTVTALDVNNNPAIGFTGTVNFSSSDSHAVLPGNYTFVTADKGTHSFSATLKTAGAQLISAQSSGVTSGTQSGIAVNAAATAQFAVTGYPSPVTAGTPHSFTVTAQDAFGNLTSGYTGTVHFTSSDGAAVLPGNHNFTSGPGNQDNGTASFNATFNTAGTQSISATDTVTAAITGTQSGIVVNSATVATSLGLAAPSPASVQFGSSGPVTLTATLTRTTGGAAVSGATVNFTVDGTAAGSAVTNGIGVAGLATYNPSSLSVGNHNVQASFAGATISATVYSSSTSATQTLGVTQATQTITFGPLGNKIYGDQPFAASATGGASGNPVTFTAGPSSVCTSGGTNGSTITIAGAGTCTVTAHQAGNSSYAAATDVPQSFTVNPATPVVAVTDPAPTFDGNSHVATATAIGVDGHTAVSGTFSFTYDGSSTAPTNAKTSYAVVADFTSTDPNYTNATGNGTLTIKQATSTTTVVGGTFTFDASPHSATVTVTGAGGLNLTPNASYTGSCNAAPVHVAETTPTCTASYTFAGDANHTGSSGSDVIVITKAPSTTVVSDGGSFGFDGNAHAATVAVTGVGGLNLTPAAVYSGACSAAPVHVSETPCTAGYTFAGDGDHFPSNGSASILIIKAPSTTTIGSGITVLFDGAAHGVLANVTGAGGVNQSVVVTYSPGGSTPPVNPGIYTATATFAGDPDHSGSSAGPVTINITFNTACAAGPGDAILPPINSDGTSVYQRKGGSTIPVKFRVCGANGVAIANASLVFGPNGTGSVTMLNAVRGTVTNINETPDVDIADAAFRWDSSGQQWIFNMATANLTSGATYTFRINLAYAPQSIVFVVGVK